MSVPDPSKTQPSASDAPERSSAKFETDLADLATRFSAHSGGGLSAELSADLALEIVLNEIVEQACLATGATGAAIVLEREGEMVCRASSGSTAPELGSRLDTSSGLSGECFKTKRTQWCDDTMSDRRADAEASERLGVRSVVVMPLLRKDEIIGVIELFSAQPYAFGVRDERTLEVLADRTLNNLDSAAHPLELQKAPEPARPPDLERQLDSQPPPDLQKTTGVPKPAPVQKPSEVQKPPDAKKSPETGKAPALYWSIRDQAEPADSGTTAGRAAGDAKTNQSEENPAGTADRPKEDRTEKNAIEKPSSGIQLAGAGTGAVSFSAKPWPDPAPPRGFPNEGSSPEGRSEKSRFKEDRVEKNHAAKDKGSGNSARAREPWNSRSTPDAGGWLLGAAAVACAILLALVAGRHWGAHNASLNGHPRVNKSAAANKNSDSANSHDSSTGSALAATNPNTDPVPPGGLVVSENGKEVFRTVPKSDHASTGDHPAAADHAVGVNRASSIEPDGVMELSPSAAENDLLQRVEPDYPEAAREQNIQGTVVLQVHIAADGGVQDVQVVSGPPVLAEASSDAVKQWKFKPRTVKGSPVEMQTTITLKFRLPQVKPPQ